MKTRKFTSRMQAAIKAAERAARALNHALVRAIRFRNRTSFRLARAGISSAILPAPRNQLRHLHDLLHCPPAVHRMPAN